MSRSSRTGSWWLRLRAARRAIEPEGPRPERAETEPDESDFFDGDPATVVRARLLDALVADEVRAIDGPHIVEYRVIGTDLTNYFGPFPTGLAALQHAEQEARRWCSEDRYEYAVIALNAPPRT